MATATVYPTFPAFEVIWDPSNLASRWEKWINRLTNYLTAMNITDTKRQKAMLLHFAGEQVHDIFDTLPVDPVPASAASDEPTTSRDRKSVV